VLSVLVCFDKLLLHRQLAVSRHSAQTLLRAFLKVVLQARHQSGGARKPDSLKPLSLEEERHSGKVFHAGSGGVPHITGKSANSALPDLPVVNRIVRVIGIMLSGLEDALVLLRRPVDNPGELLVGHFRRFNLVQRRRYLVVCQVAAFRVYSAEIS
jgi:hypothetical protein